MPSHPDRVRRHYALHVLPIGDLVEHVESEHCWCVPTVEWHEYKQLIVHNSADGREACERADAIRRLES